MDSAHAHRRPRKIRRTGRHTQPSQVEKVAEVATKAAPAVAIAGALVATAPQAASAATSLSAKTSSVAAQVHTAALVKHSAPVTRTYTVRAGDTLSSIASHFYGNGALWTWLYHVNSSVVQPQRAVRGRGAEGPHGPARPRVVLRA